MFRWAVLITFIAMGFSQGFARCGTMQYAMDLENPPKRLLKSGFTNCIPENYYGAVLDTQFVVDGQGFIIYYTLEGAHATTKRFVDSLAKYTAEAYRYHKNVIGMKEIQGVQDTEHYLKKVPTGFYPIEVIDTGLLRKKEGVYTGTFGITTGIPGSKRTQIHMENDFLYGANCAGKLSDTAFDSPIHGDYSIKGNNWPAALKMTIFHELYHSFQLAQVDITSKNRFWLEASATGVEEAGAGIDYYTDYIFGYYRIGNTFYLTGPAGAFADAGKPMEHECRSDPGCGYGYAVLYLFLHSELGLGARFDPAILGYFAKYSGDDFTMQLARLADSLGKNSDDLFNKYTEHIFYSGKRAVSSPHPLFSKNMSKWPEWKIKETYNNWDLPAGAIDFVLKTNEPPANIHPAIKVSSLNFGDSSIWVLSRLLETSYEPPPPPPIKGEFFAFPNPWNPHKPLKFQHLPENSSGVEIRTSNGMLLARIKSEKPEDLVWTPPKKLPPGILYYRHLPHGKTKVLIVQH
ncbi:MAG: hypothetical protein LBU89_09715 [Fibromonadaceae bacterium]|nr:hypothetical protein [Fibromonadaceae bacterium]